jgi:hypothetical protein
LADEHDLGSCALKGVGVRVPPSPLIALQLGEDPEGQGLRILAKVIARKLAKSRRDKNAMTYEQCVDDLPVLGDAR